MKKILFFIFLINVFSFFTNHLNANEKEKTLKIINEKCTLGFKDSGMDTNSISILCNCLVEKYEVNFKDSELLLMTKNDDEETEAPDKETMEKVQKIMNSCLEKIQK